MTWQAWNIAGFFIISILGLLSHFAFALSGNNIAIAWMVPVNESIWEHLKLAYFPWLLFSLAEYFAVGYKARNYFFAKSISALSLMLVIPIIFYSYAFCTTSPITAIDITSFFIAVAICQVLSYRLAKAGSGNPIPSGISLLFIGLLIVVFVIFTYHPPHLSPFKDNRTGAFGIPQQAV